MAVQKKRKTRSRRDMRRAHDALKGSTLGEDSTTGEVHLRHHMTPNGFFRGKQIVASKIKADDTEIEAAE